MPWKRETAGFDGGVPIGHRKQARGHRLQARHTNVLTCNVGRGMGALAPYTIGGAAQLPNVGIGSAPGLTSAFFLAGAVLTLFFADASRQLLPNA